MHRLLTRHLKKYADELINGKVNNFISAINEAYSDFEDDNQQLERTLEKSSRELIKANLELKESLSSTTAEAKNVSKRLEDVVDNVTEIIFQTDINGNWTFLNPAWTGILKYSIKESLGQPFINFVHPKGKDRDMELFSSLISSKLDFIRHSVKMLVKGGCYRDIEVFARGFRDENNVVIGVTGTLTDVTEQKKSQERLKTSQANLEAIVGSLDDIVIEVNQKFIINNVWTANESKFSVYKKKIVKKTIANVFDKEASPRLEKAVIKAIELKKTIKLEYKSLADKKWYAVKVNWLKSSTKKEQKVSILLQDISKDKKSEENLIKAKELAEQGALAKTQFLSTMSHEIRTPMNAVVGISNLLLQNDPRKDQIENLKALTFSSNNLLDLINNILDFSKIESAKIEFEKIDFDLKELINGIKQSMYFKAKEKGIDFNVKITDNLPKIIGDPTRLSQILNNLLSNAIKFTVEGSVGIDISIFKRTTKSIEINFVVIDTGIGISKNKIDTIFESFSQASSATTREYGGTGLGLAITKRLIKLLNGSYSIKSQLKKGTTFNFNLPFEVSSKPQLTKKVINLSDSDQSLVGVRVLLAEDNPVNILVVKQFLKKWKLEIEEAENGKVAVKKAEENDYDLILMDLQMPVMDGYEAAKKIRDMKDEKLEQIPIIALTADAMVGVKEKVLKAGMNDYIMKPFDPAILYNKIKKHV